jgi:hypothetical protein
VAQLYADVFDGSFSVEKMKNFKSTSFATHDNPFNEAKTPEMTIRFSFHPKVEATRFFAAISERIKAPQTNVLFAIMADESASSIGRDQIRA